MQVSNSSGAPLWPEGKDATPSDPLSAASGLLAAEDETGPGGSSTGGLLPMPLWLPYMTLSVVLVGLMVVSFVRFHVKHGHKYRRRREQFWKDLNVQNILRDPDDPWSPTSTARGQGHSQGQGQGRGQGRGRVQGQGQPVSSSMPQIAWIDFGDRTTGSDVRTIQQSPTDGPEVIFATTSGGAVPATTTTNDTGSRRQTSAPAPKANGPKSIVRTTQPNILEQFRTSVCRRSGRRNPGSVVFNSNLNGSMVNIRCGERESLRTFQTNRCLDTTTTTSVPPHHLPVPHLLLPSRADGAPPPPAGYAASRRPDVWTVQTGYRPELLLSSGSGIFGSNHSAINEDDDVSVLLHTPL